MVKSSMKRSRRRYRRFKRKSKMSFVRRVLSVVKPEFKYIYTSVANDSSTIAIQYANITSVGQGDTLTTRTGNRISIHSIECSVYWTTPTTASESYMVRWGIFKHNQGADAPVDANIFNNGVVSVPTGCLRQGSYKDQYVMLWDQMAGLPIQTADLASQRFKYYKKFKKPRPVQFFGTNSTDYMKDTYYFWYCGETDTITQAPAIYMQCMVRFTDS